MCNFETRTISEFEHCHLLNLMPSHWHWQVADFSDDQIDKVSRLPFLSPENVQIVIELPNMEVSFHKCGYPKLDSGWFELENPTKMDDWGYPHDQTESSMAVAMEL